jgi:lipoprotein NlpI
MHRRLFTALVASVAWGWAPQGVSAAAYDDFANGVAAYERGDNALAISSLTAALSAPDLASNLKVTAYMDRARAYLRAGQCAQVLPDLNAAKALGANALEVMESTASAQNCAGDFKSAEASYTSAIAVDPRWQFFWARGRARWEAGDFADAAADFKAVISVKPDYQYPLLWLAITQFKLAKPDAVTLVHGAAALDLSEWPGPIVKFYTGGATRQDIDAAVRSDAQNMAGRQCEADFYIAEWDIAQNDRDGARSRLQSATDKCPHNFVERNAAEIEIARLK